ncbi:hypothetical protein Agabi119p4_4091 [Agaricus bisporus var. burnettii]|uniref:Uncharacterized protein n=1 Tax=Agaricus bisporus var. burnettii TaxID=192524 RepID=A0A8H7KH21_AGABI|nr:hypothetical protein Agabi119p4_4091 [Agaricus bisporus var. burnettii]
MGIAVKLDRAWETLGTLSHRLPRHAPWFSVHFTDLTFTTFEAPSQNSSSFIVLYPSSKPSARLEAPPFTSSQIKAAQYSSPKPLPFPFPNVLSVLIVGQVPTHRS